jgi:hypothetical protein
LRKGSPSAWRFSTRIAALARRPSGRFADFSEIGAHTCLCLKLVFAESPVRFVGHGDCSIVHCVRLLRIFAPAILNGQTARIALLSHDAFRIYPRKNLSHQAAVVI